MSGSKIHDLIMVVDYIVHVHVRKALMTAS